MSPEAPVLYSFEGIDPSLPTEATTDVHRASEKLAPSHAGRSESRYDIRPSGEGKSCKFGMSKVHDSPSQYSLFFQVADISASASTG